jgi:probable phosphoglycerate mutase
MVIIMKILIVRHADPDYSIDSLTPQGKLEAELLSQRLSKLNVKEFYVSPLGRAKDTAAYTLSKLNRTAIECDWLKEFPCVINRPDKDNIIAWDWLPEDWTSIKAFYSIDDWANVSAMSDGNVLSEFKYVTEEFDKILANHGYLRHQKLYKTITPNEDTIILFCHFGVECVLLSHLLGISPMLLWHGFCAAPSSVTTIVSEERREGIAYFRVSGFGDISHLYSAGEEPSFAARFCETYYNSTQRHD